ncbi:hypothetical protein VULLAG_LOCUS3709 [Vulpes lagopus]
MKPKRYQRWSCHPGKFPCASSRLVSDIPEEKILFWTLTVDPPGLLRMAAVSALSWGQFLSGRPMLLRVRLLRPVLSWFRGCCCAGWARTPPFTSYWLFGPSSLSSFCE